MTLKSKTVVHQEVDYDDLEKFVKEKTGRDWSFVAAGEYGNGEQHTFITNGKPLESWDAKEMKIFIDHNAGYPSPHTMFNWLTTEGHIQPGRYLVSIDW